jgi:tripartite-type tricarboxylate transporter receptor subunit TctC
MIVRHRLHPLAGLCLISSLALIVSMGPTDAFPEKTIKIVIPFSPGGAPT